MGQDLVSFAGSNIVVLPHPVGHRGGCPTGTSTPSMLIGGAYSLTSFTLGMTYSRLVSFAARTRWSLTTPFRGPENASLRDTDAGRFDDRFDGDRDVAPNWN